MDHELRKRGLGGSDIAAIVGQNPYRSALDVWLEKTGRASSSQDNLRMKLGRWLEPIVGQLYSDETGFSLRRGTTYQHKSMPYVVGTPDYLVVEQPRGLEIKTTGYFDPKDWGPAGTDFVPMPYLIQSIWYAFLMDLPSWDLAALASNRDFRIYHLIRDDGLVADLLEAAGQFWNDYVIPDREPPLEIFPSPAVERYLNTRYATQASDVFVKATGEAEFWSDTLRNVRREKQELEATELEIVNNLKSLIGESAGIEGSGFLHTWKQAKDGKTIDWQAVAMELQATPALIMKHTKTKPGSRRFLVKWLDDETGEE